MPRTSKRRQKKAAVRKITPPASESSNDTGSESKDFSVEHSSDTSPFTTPDVAQGSEPSELASRRSTNKRTPSKTINSQKSDTSKESTSNPKALQTKLNMVHVEQRSDGVATTDSELVDRKQIKSEPVLPNESAYNSRSSTEKAVPKLKPKPFKTEVKTELEVEQPVGFNPTIPKPFRTVVKVEPELVELVDFNAELPLIPMEKLAHPPKKALSAGQYFYKKYRKSYKDYKPDLTTSEVNTGLKKVWGALSDAERAPFLKLAADDKERYNVQKEAYLKKKSEFDSFMHAQNCLRVEKEKEYALRYYRQELAKRQVRAPNARLEKIQPPKGPLTKWNFFQKHYYKQLKEGESGVPLSFISSGSEAGAEYRKLQASKKKKDKNLLRSFEKLAEEDRERYKKEMKEYNSRVAENHRKKMEAQNALKDETWSFYNSKEYRNTLLPEGTNMHGAERSKKEEDPAVTLMILKRREKMPPRPPSAYTFFLKEKLPDLGGMGLRKRELPKQAGLIWRAMGEDEKAKFRALAREAADSHQPSGSQPGSSSDPNRQTAE